MFGCKVRKRLREFKKMYRAGEVNTRKVTLYGYHTLITTKCKWGVLETHLNPTSFFGEYHIKQCTYLKHELGLSFKQIEKLAFKIHDFLNNNERSL